MDIYRSGGLFPGGLYRSRAFFVCGGMCTNFQKFDLSIATCEMLSWEAYLFISATMALARVVVLPLPIRIATVLI